MNQVALIGRLTREPDVRYTTEGLAVARFTLAVDRRVKKDGGQTADFISCVAFGKSGEFVEKYFSQGLRVGVAGRIQTGSYENKDGQKVYTTDVIAESLDFADGKQQQSNATPAQDLPEDKWVNADTLEDELPFK